MNSMNNYAVARQAAEARFCQYDPGEILKKPGVFLENGYICTTFLGESVRVDTQTGKVWVAGRTGDFGETLTVLDWMCDRKEDARASFEFCPVSSLPGVLVSGGTLVMNFVALAAKIGKSPETFLAACKAMGGKSIPLGDIGMELMAFPDLPLQLKFYHADEEFPASMTLLFDRNTLQFIRYETVYYLAACLQNQLVQKIQE